MLEYAVLYPNKEYVVKPTNGTISDVENLIRNHPWENGLSLYEEINNLDKEFPLLDVGEDSKENMFFCSCTSKGKFEISFSDPEKRPKGLKKIIHTFLHPGGGWHSFKNCNVEQAIHLLKIWHDHSDEELLNILREGKTIPQQFH
ncbi:MAG: hypothetical protein JW927_06445 [Deltaproteobacteria bacterium]|nr:hypothetical protein [Deltaproteobacteria bacterium]